MNRQRIRGTGAVVALLVSALVVPLMAASMGDAAPTQGCTAVGFSNQQGEQIVFTHGDPMPPNDLVAIDADGARRSC